MVLQAEAATISQGVLTALFREAIITEEATAVMQGIISVTDLHLSVIACHQEVQLLTGADLALVIHTVQVFHAHTRRVTQVTLDLHAVDPHAVRTAQDFQEAVHRAALVARVLQEAAHHAAQVAQALQGAAHHRAVAQVFQEVAHHVVLVVPVL
jgi:acyl carrier protein phosphodiesterase